MNVGSSSTFAYPIADAQVAAKLLALINQAASYSQLRRGINECVKALKKSEAQLVVLAADAAPLEILMHVPQVCEESNVIYTFVNSKAALGRAAGLDRQAVACCITRDGRSQLGVQISEMIKKLEAQFI